MQANLQIQNITIIINLASQETKLDLTKGLMIQNFIQEMLFTLENHDVQF